jgi:hypothetical protein
MERVDRTKEKGAKEKKGGFSRLFFGERCWSRFGSKLKQQL